MARENLQDFLAFLAVARERSFTRAAAQLGLSQSTLSHTVKQLEARLGVRLLTRTTRSVAPTEAGERLMHALGPHFEGIEAAIVAVGDLRDKPAGTVRIAATDYAANTVLWPKLAKLLAAYPDIRIEIAIDYGLQDIVAERFDLGVRFGDQVAKDMIAVRIGPDRRMAIVGSPAYLRRRPEPTTPRQLVEHNCINLRLPTHGGLFAWELVRKGKALQVQVDGQIVLSNTYQMLAAALAGCGLAYLPEDLVESHVARGRLRKVLEAWWPTFSGHHAYYPSRRQSSLALRLVVEALRHRTD